ncbi:hypothetical protein HDV00_007224 [Rhizophlyctis rosea]|nr:hypothetical protein HDV00_007224 [Rhizophlyctis rosea]
MKVEFVDLFQGSTTIRVRNCKLGKAEWTTVGPGINLEGFCENESCPAGRSRQLVVHQRGFQTYTLADTKSSKCPSCQDPFRPTRVGFLQCRFRFSGVRNAENGGIIRREAAWSTTPAESIYYERFSTGIATWRSLIIEAEVLGHHRTDCGVCQICQHRQLVNAEDLGTVGCGHTFCYDCIDGHMSERPDAGCPLCGHVARQFGLVCLPLSRGKCRLRFWPG